MKRKILIASGSPETADALCKIIPFDALGLELVGAAESGAALLRMIAEREPELALTELSLPDMSGLECIRRAAGMNSPCRFLAMSDRREFDSVYGALRCGAEDFLLLPADPAEVTEALSRAVNRVRRTEMISDTEHSIAIRKLFFQKAIYDLDQPHPSLTEINQTYKTRFQNGLFCTLFVRYDYVNILNNINFSETIQGNLVSLQETVNECIEQSLGTYCYDIVLGGQFNGSKVLLNYPSGNEAVIKEQLALLLDRIKGVVHLFGDIDVTICTSDTFANINHAKHSVKEADLVSWTRILKGTGSVLLFEAEGALRPEFAAQLQALEEETKKAVEILNVSDFIQCGRKLFSLPNAVLIRHEVKSFVDRMIDFYFETNGDLIEEITNKDILYTSVIHMLKSASTLATLKEVYLSELAKTLRRLAEISSLRQRKPVKEAIQYVEDHYNETLTLEHVAEAICISPGYFSSIFKKETGRNFTQYVAEFRVRKAKELLKEGSMKINEIADEVGYFDQRYFSKIFKKYVGCTPSEYKRIYHG